MLSALAVAGNMDDATRAENENFEAEVRRIGRELWPTARDSGPIKIDGQERDGIFETEECIHLLEATTSRRKEKAKEDIQKLVKLASKIRPASSTKAVKCWFITRDEPTVEQLEVARKHPSLVSAISFPQFASKLVNAAAYLAARDNYPFGSVRDPLTGDPVPDVDYIPLDLIDVASRFPLSPSGMLQKIARGDHFLLLGDFGAGKSMTLRYLYHQLRDRYNTRVTPHFPVYLNLRDHFGQSDPTEILERHAKTVGFPQPIHLIRAWRAGYVILLLDGFDEVTTIGIQGLWRKLQNNRYRAMEPVRRFVQNHPHGVGLVLAGRAHFFDSEQERRSALGLGAHTIELSLNEFTEEQVRDYLKKTGLIGALPSWLPSRPLLVGYLAAKGILQPLVGESGAKGPDPATGWDYLLNAIAERESKIEAGIDGQTVRRILERLATKARSKEGGLGPLSADEVVSSFKDICGYSPDEKGMVLLQRLPGLGIDQIEEETRKFIDEDFADACRAGDAAEFIKRPHDFDAVFQNIECTLGVLGVAVTACKAAGVSQKQINAALSSSLKTGAQHLAIDICRIAMERGLDLDGAVDIHGILIPDLECGAASGNARAICFNDCFFERVGVDSDVDPARLPRFQQCYISELDGRLSKTDLPPGIFDDDCVIDSFAVSGETTNEILSLDLPLGVRVLLTILKKLYQRRGSGRRENALNRGLDHRSRRYVDDVLRILETRGLGLRCKRGENTIWLPVRDATKRVGRIVASPNTVDDLALRDAASLSNG